MEKTAEYWIDQLELIGHPEGGYFKETYRSPINFIPNGFSSERVCATSIYFMLKTGEVSHFHKLKQDEIWYYHFGNPLTVYTISPDGNLNELKIGPNPEKGEVFQALVPAGTIFGSTMNEAEGYSLVGCMVNPGFDFADFHLYKTSELVKLYPQHEEVIKHLTKETYKVS